MKTEVMNRLRLGKLVAAEITATLNDHRAWIGVYPIRMEEQGDYHFRIRMFEVHEKYLEEDNDVWEDTMEKKMDYFAESEEKLMTILQETLGDTNILDAPWKCDYPV